MATPLPQPLFWRDAQTARKHLSHALTPDGQSFDLFGEAFDVLAKGRIHVTLA